MKDAYLEMTAGIWNSVQLQVSAKAQIVKVVGLVLGNLVKGLREYIPSKAVPTT